MQVILDSSFARPGSAPIWGGKKGEFRDWTSRNTCFSRQSLAVKLPSLLVRYTSLTKITFENSPNPLSVKMRLCKHRKKCSIAFIK